MQPGRDPADRRLRKRVPSASTSRSRRRRYCPRIRRRWRSSSPRARKSANACCSIRAVPQSARSFSSATASRSCSGTTSQPRRSAGASVLLDGAGVDDAVRAPGPGGPRRRHGRSGTRRRSRPRSRSRRARGARRGARGRRSPARTAPVGCWWAGREDDRVDVGPLELVDPHPSSSTATGTISRPASDAIRRCSGWLGFSNAIRLAPLAARTRQTMPWPCEYPDVTTTRAGSATTPRTRPRYSASAERRAFDPARVSVEEVGVGDLGDCLRAASEARRRAGSARRPGHSDGGRIGGRGCERRARVRRASRGTAASETFGRAPWRRTR